MFGRQVSDLRSPVVSAFDQGRPTSFLLYQPQQEGDRSDITLIWTHAFRTRVEESGER